jgi:outer membrane protein assembly factor BamB
LFGFSRPYLSLLPARAVLVAGLCAACTEAVSPPADRVVPIRVVATPDLDTLRLSDSLVLRVAADSLTPLAVQWIVGLRDTVVADSLVYHPRAAGTEFVHALASFPGERSGEATRGLVTLPNAAPTVAIVAVAPSYLAQVPTGDTVVLAAAYADPDGDPVEVRWFAGDPDSGVANLLATGDTVRVPVDTAGQYAVVVEARDPAGNRAAVLQEWGGYDPITPAAWRTHVGPFSELTATGAGLIVAGNGRYPQRLRAIDASGTLVWELAIGGSQTSRIPAGDDEVYVSAFPGVNVPGTLSRVSESGVIEWSLTDVEEGPVMLPDGSLVVPSGKGSGTWSTMRRISRDGMVMWSVPVDSVIWWGSGEGVAVGPDSAIYIRCAFTPREPRLIRLEHDGSLAWSRDMVVNSLTVADDSTLVVAGSDSIYGLRPDGTIRWSRSPGAAEVVVGTGGVAYHIPYYGPDRGLFAFRTTDGADLWSRLVDSAGLISGIGPVLTAGGAVIVAAGHSLIVVDAATGAERWRHEMAGAPVASPLLTDQGLLVASDWYGYVEAIDIGAGPADSPWPMAWGGNRRRGRPNSP